MRQPIVPGGHIDALTAEEAVELLRATYREEVEERVRAAASILLDATGSGTDEVYSPPVGFEFEARRVTVELDTAGDPGTGNQVLGAGHTVEYLRSGQRIEWGQPQFGAAVQVPGAQTWGSEQGPYIRNGETFELRARGIGAAGGRLLVTVEGILRRPAAGNAGVHRPPTAIAKRGPGTGSPHLTPAERRPGPG